MVSQPLSGSGVAGLLAEREDGRVDMVCGSCGSDDLVKDPDVQDAGAIPLLCLACGWRGRRTPKVSCPRCTSPEVLESAVDGWAYDDFEDARENPGSAGWGHVDKSHFRCTKCHHEWTAVTGPLRPFAVEQGRVVAKFQDDDSGYRSWIRAYPSGYVLNCERHPSPNYLIVHRADCASVNNLQPGA